MNKVYLILLLDRDGVTICFLKAEFINLREFPSTGRGRDTTSCLIYKKIKTIIYLTRYSTCYASFSPLTQYLSLLLFPFFPVKNIKNN